MATQRRDETLRRWRVAASSGMRSLTDEAADPGASSLALTSDGVIITALLLMLAALLLNVAKVPAPVRFVDGSIGFRVASTRCRLSAALDTCKGPLAASPCTSMCRAGRFKFR